MEPDGTDTDRVSHLENRPNDLCGRCWQCTQLYGDGTNQCARRRNAVFNNSWLMEMHVCASVCECVKHGQ